MLKIQEIREIIKLIDQSSIEKFSYESDGAKLELKKGNGAQVGSSYNGCRTSATCSAGNFCCASSKNRRSNCYLNRKHQLLL